jgi:hypothetical protein
VGNDYLSTLYLYVCVMATKNKNNQFEPVEFEAEVNTAKILSSGGIVLTLNLSPEFVNQFSNLLIHKSAGNMLKVTALPFKKKVVVKEVAKAPIKKSRRKQTYLKYGKGNTP